MSGAELARAVLAGGVVGVVVSLLGGGGTIFIIPVLLIVFEQSFAKTTGTSLVVVFAGALVGALQHLRRGRVSLRVFAIFGPASMFGAGLGARLHALVSEEASRVALLLVLALAGARMMFGAMPDRATTELAPAGRIAALGLVAGLLTGFVGVGGGFLIVPALVWGARVALSEAIGTSVALIVVSSAVGAATHLFQGHVEPTLATTMALGSMVGALFGAPLTGKIPERPLRATFGAMVLCVVGYLAFSG